MTGLTLKQLRKAIHIVKTAKRFADVRDDAILPLVVAEAYLMGNTQQDTPRDPREVLNRIGYKR